MLCQGAELGRRPLDNMPYQESEIRKLSMPQELIDFIRERLDGEVADAQRVGGLGDGDRYDYCWGEHVDPEFMLRDAESKRAILDTIAPKMSEYESVKLLRLLALPYSGHPDYREEWRP